MNAYEAAGGRTAGRTAAAAAKNEQVSWTAYIDCPIGNGTAQSELTDELIQSTACLELSGCSSAGSTSLAEILKLRPSGSSCMSGETFSDQRSF